MLPHDAPSSLPAELILARPQRFRRGSSRFVGPGSGDGTYRGAPYVLTRHDSPHRR